MIAYLGLIWLGVLTLSAWGWLSILQSGAPLLGKAIWTVAVWVPVIGFIGWYLLGPRART